MIEKPKFDYRMQKRLSQKNASNTSKKEERELPEYLYCRGKRIRVVIIPYELSFLSD